MDLPDFLAESEGFEPSCDCSQTDFECCMGLSFSGLERSKQAFLKMPQTHVAQGFADVPTSTDRNVKRNVPSSNKVVFLQE
jgi:hypothetical protein